MSKKILIASQSFGTQDETPIRLLEENGFELIKNTEHKKYTEEELLELIGGCVAAVVGSDPFTSQVINAGNELKILAKSGVGVDNIDLTAADEKGIYVTNTPGAVETAVAESTMGMILSLCRNICIGNDLQKQGEWPRLCGSELTEKTLGIVGLGNIGKKVAKMAAGFDMRIFGYDPYADSDFCSQNGITLCTLDELLENSDIVTLHAPYNKANHNMIDREALEKMKPEAYLINASRGGLIDEDALYVALLKKHIAGAALDCYKKEPTTVSMPLFELDNCIVTPHIAGYSKEANYRVGMIVAKNIIAACNGDVPLNVVNSI